MEVRNIYLILIVLCQVEDMSKISSTKPLLIVQEIVLVILLTGIDSTYDEYLFLYYTDMRPSTDGYSWNYRFQDKYCMLGPNLVLTRQVDNYIVGLHGTAQLVDESGSNGQSVVLMHPSQLIDSGEWYRKSKVIRGIILIMVLLKIVGLRILHLFTP